MADSQVGDLTAATTPLSGSEDIHAVQSGNSRKLTPNNILEKGAVRFDGVQSLTDAQKEQARSNIGGVIPNAVIEDQKAYNVAGGTFTAAAWQTRDFNTEVRDPDSLISVSSNAFTVTVDGWVEWSCPAFMTDRHTTRLYNVTDSAVVVYGTTEYARNSYTVQNRSFGGGAVVAGKTYRIEHYAAVTRSTQGFGVESDNSGVASVYSRLKFWRA
jgi:hypothetical protein